MSRSNVLRAVSKALIALAWEDGEVTTQEMSLLKDVTFRLPEMTPADWRDLDIYWITRIGERERKILFAELVNTLKTDDDKRYVFQLCGDMVMADGQVLPEETAALNAVEQALDKADDSLMRAMSQLLKAVLSERGSKLNDISSDYFRNRVFQLMQQKLGSDMQAKLQLDEFELRRLALAGALMARIAYVDRQISDRELAAMDSVLQQEWSLRNEHAQVVVDCAVDAATHNLDNDRLFREFYEATLPHERVDFLNVLFKVAFADKGVSDDEFGEIEHIAKQLKIAPEEFEDAHIRAARLLGQK